MTLLPPDEARADLVARHQAGVYRYLIVLGATPHEAEDLAQEAFVDLLKAIRKRRFAIEAESATAAWLRRAAKHRLIDLRRRRGEVRLEIEALDRAWQALTPDDDMPARLARLADCRAKLELRAAEALRLRYDCDLNSEEIAKALATSADGARSLLKRARALLRECLEKEHHHE